MRSERGVQMVDHRHEPDPRVGAPHWVKVSVAIGGSFALLMFVIMLLGHGPGRHIPGNGTPGYAPAGDDGR